MASHLLINTPNLVISYIDYAGRGEFKRRTLSSLAFIETKAINNTTLDAVYDIDNSAYLDKNFKEVNNYDSVVFICEDLPRHMHNYRNIKTYMENKIDPLDGKLLFSKHYDNRPADFTLLVSISKTFVGVSIPSVNLFSLIIMCLILGPRIANPFAIMTSLYGSTKSYDDILDSIYQKELSIVYKGETVVMNTRRALGFLLMTRAKVYFYSNNLLTNEEDTPTKMERDEEELLKMLEQATDPRARQVTEGINTAKRAIFAINKSRSGRLLRSFDSKNKKKIIQWVYNILLFLYTSPNDFCFGISPLKQLHGNVSSKAGRGFIRNLAFEGNSKEEMYGVCTEALFGKKLSYKDDVKKKYEIINSDVDRKKEELYIKSFAKQIVSKGRPGINIVIFVNEFFSGKDYLINTLDFMIKENRISGAQIHLVSPTNAKTDKQLYTFIRKTREEDVEEKKAESSFFLVSRDLSSLKKRIEFVTKITSDPEPKNRIVDDATENIANIITVNLVATLNKREINKKFFVNNYPFSDKKTKKTFTPGKRIIISEQAGKQWYDDYFKERNLLLFNNKAFFFGGKSTHESIKTFME